MVSALGEEVSALGSPGSTPTYAPVSFVRLSEPRWSFVLGWSYHCGVQRLKHRPRHSELPTELDDRQPLLPTCLAPLSGKGIR